LQKAGTQTILAIPYGARVPLDFAKRSDGFEDCPYGQALSQHLASHLDQQFLRDEFDQLIVIESRNSRSLGAAQRLGLSY
jgi:hypothetical protein